MEKSNQTGKLKKMEGSSINELLLKGIYIGKSPAVALFGVRKQTRPYVRMHFANEAFFQFLNLEKAQCEDGVRIFLKRLWKECGEDPVDQAQHGEWKIGETKQYFIPIPDEKDKEKSYAAEVTFLENRKQELLFLVFVRHNEKLTGHRQDGFKEGTFDENRYGKMEVFLQPKFSLTTRKPIGAEALARWIKEDGSIVMPSKFVPMLEKGDRIIELDFYIFERVLMTMQKWREKGYQMLPVSVNFSRKHIQKENFVSRICLLTEKYSIDHALIEIEITESAVSGDDTKMMRDMRQLQTAGFKVDMDDFGTGYSSLNMLLKAPIDVVKVDKSFLCDITNSTKDREYVDHLASLIRVADKDIVVEGVETEHQAEILKNCGYTKAQGFLFGEAVPISEFTRKYMHLAKSQTAYGT
ncbi:MAG: EAL domain-containing protein [Lachnospiraceae bacterium]